jgi:hypothetical protein
MQLVGADAEVMKSVAETEGSRVLFSYGCSGEEGSVPRLRRILMK